MGDDTWAQLAPASSYHGCHTFPSFDVHDLHTVDDGVWRVRQVLAAATVGKQDMARSSVHGEGWRVGRAWMGACHEQDTASRNHRRCGPICGPMPPAPVVARAAPVQRDAPIVTTAMSVANPRWTHLRKRQRTGSCWSRTTWGWTTRATRTAATARRCTASCSRWTIRSLTSRVRHGAVML